MEDNRIPLPEAAVRIGVTYHSLIMKIRKGRAQDIKINGRRYLTEKEVNRLRTIEHLKQQKALLEA